MTAKLAGGLSDASREALESLVAMGDTSVPGIEASDINDGDIMANTRERVKPDGTFQFVYTPLPDPVTGKQADPIESDWIQQDFKKRVIMGWCEGVKNALVSRSQAGLVAANEAALEAKLKRQREEQFGDEQLDSAVPEPTVVARDTPAPAQRPSARPAPAPQTEAYANAGFQNASTSSDPADYVDGQLGLARERLIAAQQAQQDILREVLAAKRDYEKWQALSRALSGIGGDAELRGDEGDSAEALILPAVGGIRRPSADMQGERTVVRSNPVGTGAVRRAQEFVSSAVPGAGTKQRSERIAAGAETRRQR